MQNAVHDMRHNGIHCPGAALSLTKTKASGARAKANDD